MDLSHILTVNIDHCKTFETPFGGDEINCPSCNSYFDIVYIGDDEHENYDIKYDNIDFIKDSVYCKKCHIIFGICCVECERGCSESTNYSELLVIITSGIEIINPDLSIEQIIELDKLIKEGTVKYRFECMCPGMCTHRDGSYPEYVGLGIDCCKISEELRNANKIIFEKRMKISEELRNADKERMENIERIKKCR